MEACLLWHSWSCAGVMPWTSAPLAPGRAPAALTLPAAPAAAAERGLRPMDVYGGVHGAAAQLAGLESWFAWQREFAFYSSSVLIMYEGDATGEPHGWWAGGSLMSRATLTPPPPHPLQALRACVSRFAWWTLPTPSSTSWTPIALAHPAPAPPPSPAAGETPTSCAACKPSLPG